MSNIVDRLRSMATLDIDCNDATIIVKAIEEAADGIERLRGELAAALKNEVHYAKRIEELLPKIEEERKEVARLRRSMKEMTSGNCRIITDAQIDAAWARRVLIPSADNDDSANTYIPAAKLGIVRCELCKEDRDNMAWGEGGILCSRCNGHGWVMEADDE